MPRLKRMNIRCYYLKIDDDALFIIGRATFEKKRNINFLYLIMNDDDLFNNRSTRPNFLIGPFLNMINSEVEKKYPPSNLSMKWIALIILSITFFEI